MSYFDVSALNFAEGVGLLFMVGLIFWFASWVLGLVLLTVVSLLDRWHGR